MKGNLPNYLKRGAVSLLNNSVPISLNYFEEFCSNHFCYLIRKISHSHTNQIMDIARKNFFREVSRTLKDDGRLFIYTRLQNQNSRNINDGIMIDSMPLNLDFMDKNQV